MTVVVATSGRTLSGTVADLLRHGHSIVVVAIRHEVTVPGRCAVVDLATMRHWALHDVDVLLGSREIDHIEVRDDPGWPAEVVYDLVRGLARRRPVLFLSRDNRPLWQLAILAPDVALVDELRGVTVVAGQSDWHSGMPLGPGDDIHPIMRLAELFVPPRSAPQALEPPTPVRPPRSGSSGPPTSARGPAERFPAPAESAFGLPQSAPPAFGGPSPVDQSSPARSVNVLVARPGQETEVPPVPLVPGAPYAVLLNVGVHASASLLSRRDAGWPDDLLGRVDLRPRVVLYMAGWRNPEVRHFRLPPFGASFACECPAPGPCRSDCARRKWVRFPVTAPEEVGAWTGELAIYVGVVAVHVQRLILSVGVGGSPRAQVTYRLTTDFADLGPLADRTASILMTEGGSRAVVNRAGFIDNPVCIGANAADAAVREARQLLHDLHLRTGRRGPVSTADAHHRKDPDAFAADLAVLARHGALVYDRLFRDNEVFDTLPELIRHEARARGRPAVITVTDPAVADLHRKNPVPWSMVYDLPMPRDPEIAYRVCPSVQRFGPDGSREPPPPHCLEPDHSGNVLCPFGFWGLGAIVEQPVSTDRVVWHVSRTSRPRSLAVAVDPGLDELLTKQHLADLSTLLPFDRVDTGVVTSAREVAALLAEENMDIAYLYCHGGYHEHATGRPLPVLRFGTSTLDPVDVANWRRDPGLWPRPHWPTRKPLVVMNGCHTAEMTTSTLANFVDAFANRAGAAGVIGTEVSLEQGMASWAMTHFFQALLADANVGDALRSLRWYMIAHGNVMGLAYTMYSVAGLRLRPDKGTTP